MKTRKIFPGIFLAVILIMVLAPAAPGALLNKEFLTFQFGGSSPLGDTSGILAFTNLSALLSLYKTSDGTKTPVSGKLNVRLMGYIANLN